jgi:acylphosphatase
MKKKFIFQGKVQGVGFRYAAKMLAGKYNLVGWVKNNDDGSVILVTDGLKNDIQSLIDSLQDGFHDNIENIEESIEKDGGLIGFEIK